MDAKMMERITDHAASEWLNGIFQFLVAWLVLQAVWNLVLVPVLGVGHMVYWQGLLLLVAYRLLK